MRAVPTGAGGVTTGVPIVVPVGGNAVLPAVDELLVSVFAGDDDDSDIFVCSGTMRGFEQADIRSRLRM